MNDHEQPDRRHYARPHDAWQCNAVGQPGCGGCGLHGAGQESCAPRPSLRLRRGVFVASCTALIGGLLLALVTSPVRTGLLAPGPLASAHAGLLAMEGSEGCATCHGAAERSLADWMRDAVSAGRHIPVSQSDLCMNCHSRTLVAQFHTAPHNVAPQTLAAMTAAAIADHGLKDIRPPGSATHELACSACHREHQGRDFNLAALTNQQCQVCHVQYVHRFETDHPEFRNWPGQRGRNIRFDHASHGLKHFPGLNASFDCTRCHIDDERGNVKLLAPFSQSCATCHADQITGEQGPDWTLLQLPMLDTQALATSGLSVGEWPAACEGDFDGELPPAMKLLLWADPEVRDILDRRGPDFQFGDLDAENPTDLQEAASLAWAIKRLVHELAEGGAAALRDRITAAVDGDAALRESMAEWTGLTYGLDRDAFLDVQQQWLPGLQGELTKVDETNDGKPADRASAGRLLARTYGRPAITSQETDDDLLAENPLAGLMAGQTPSGSDDANASAASTPGNTESELAQSRAAELPVVRTPPGANPATGQIDNQWAAAQTTAPVQDDDLLAANPLARGVPSSLPNDASQESEPNGHTSRPPDSSLPTESPNLQSPNLQSPILQSPILQSPNLQSIARSLVANGSREIGGWHRNDRTFSLAWRPVSHTDPVLKNWIDLGGKLAAERGVQASGLAGELMDIHAAGSCMSCHTRSRQESGAIQVDWRPQTRDPSIREFTRFPHAPHELQTATADCTSCHRIQKMHGEPVNLAAALAAERQPIADFEPMSRGACATCHRQGGASSGCVDCHNYHVGSRVTDP